MELWPYVHPDIPRTFVEPHILEYILKTRMSYGCFHHEIAYTSHTLPKRILLGNACDTNAYHVFFFMIARFYYFDNQKDEIVYYYNNPQTPYLIEQALQHLPKRFRRETEKQEGYEYIEMPGLAWLSDGILEPWIYEYVKELYKEIWSSVKQEKGKYTYISRNKRDISNRCCLNEDELVPLLKEAGFSCYTLNTLTFVDQIKLFRSSEVITGVHGAGLAWLLFCEPGTSVVEIQHPSWGSERGFYVDMGRRCNLHYHLFTNAREPTKEECETYNGTDVIVDKNSYINALYYLIRKLHS